MSRILTKISEKYQESLTQTSTISYCDYDNDPPPSDHLDLKIFIASPSPRRHISGCHDDFQHIQHLELFNVKVVWSEVFRLLKIMPKLVCLNLRMNATLENFYDRDKSQTDFFDLSEVTVDIPDETFPALETLILNGTNVDFIGRQWLKITKMQVLVQTYIITITHTPPCRCSSASKT